MSSLARMIFAFPLCLALAAARAEPGYQSHASIVESIHQRVESEFRQRGQDYQAEVLPLDPRLRLPECGRPLETFLPQGRREAGAWSVGVRCEGERPWTIYGRANVRGSVEVVVLRNAVRSGGLIGPADIAMMKKDLAGLGGDYLTDPAQAVGQVARRGLAGGTLLSHEQLTAPKLVQRGERVVIRAESGGYQISSGGEALADGQKGQRVRVRNEQSGRVVQGTVAGPGLVLVQ